MTTPNLENNSLPLEELSIVPEWLKSTPKSFEHHTGEDKTRPSRGPRRPDNRPPRTEERGAPRPRPQGERPPRRDRPPRPQAPKGPPVERRPLPPPVAPMEISFVPEEKGFAAMIETMKHSRHTYSLFDVAKLVLNKPERHALQLTRKAAADGTRAPLFLVNADESVFLNQDEAVRYLFRRHADKLCREEKKPVEPPKGNFTFVNRCGITGELFGPPNYHEYQGILVRFHQRRLRHMPFEEFKARIQTTHDPEAVKKWIESKSFVTEQHCLLCAEPKVLASRDELEKHITETHLPQLITSAAQLQVAGLASRQQASEGVAEAMRLAWLSERKFPLKTAQTISDRLRPEGFHFFKHGKGITYVSHIRPKRFETLDGLSDQVQKIITFLRAHPDSVRKQLADNLQSPDAERLLADLHWLIEEGYVVEFANGRLWALENKPPVEPKPEPAPVVEAARPAESAPAIETKSETETPPAAPTQA